MQTCATKTPQNARIRHGLAAEMACMDFLEGNGFTVIKTVNGEHAMPVIHIQTSGKCNLLKERHNALCYGYRGDADGRIKIWRADVLGCRVEWTERGH